MTLHDVFLKLISQRKLNIDIQIYGNLGNQVKNAPRFFPFHCIKLRHHTTEEK